MIDSLGDTAQIRSILQQIAKATVIEIEAVKPTREAAVHPLVKWLVGAIAGLGGAAIIGLGIWLVSSVSQMQVTLARLDERMAAGSIKDGRFDDLERRVTKLEAVVAEGGDDGHP